VARMGDRKCGNRVYVGYPRERDDLEQQGVDVMIILKCIFKTWDGEARIGLIWLRSGTYGGCL